MLELVDTTMLTLEVNEKEQAPLGQRIRAVDMCFYNKEDLAKGKNYQLRRNSDKPKDTVSRFGAGISQWIYIYQINININLRLILILIDWGTAQTSVKDYNNLLLDYNNLLLDYNNLLLDNNNH